MVVCTYLNLGNRYYFGLGDWAPVSLVGVEDPKVVHICYKQEDRGVVDGSGDQEVAGIDWVAGQREKDTGCARAVAQKEVGSLGSGSGMDYWCWREDIGSGNLRG